MLSRFESSLFPVCGNQKTENSSIPAIQKFILQKLEPTVVKFNLVNSNSKMIKRVPNRINEVSITVLILLDIYHICSGYLHHYPLPVPSTISFLFFSLILLVMVRMDVNCFIHLIVTISISFKRGIFGSTVAINRPS